MRFTRPSSGALAFGSIAVFWLVGFAFLHGHGVSNLAPSDTTHLHERLGDLNDWVGDHRSTNPVLRFLDGVRRMVDALTTALMTLIAQSSTGAGYPMVGWLGVTAISTWVAAAFGNLRTAAVVVVCFLAMGVLGHFTESMQTLALTIAAVIVSVVIGIPIGLWAGLDHRVERVLTPLLDLAQILPTFVYLAPLALIFLIGNAAAVITTVIYAAPPLIRLTMHGVRSVPEGVDEATASLGITRGQRLRLVVLPLARRSIVLGLNQTTMAALAMATIAALIAAPGLGQAVITALQAQDVGAAATSGAAVVLLAIALDRTTTVVGLKERTGRPGRLGLVAAGVGLVVALVAVQLSRTVVSAARFPADLTYGKHVAAGVNQVSDWFTDTLSPVTLGLRDGVTNGLLNPLQSLLTNSPVILVALVVMAVAAVATHRSRGAVGAVVAAVSTAAATGVVYLLGVWGDSMVTLASTLVAGALTMIIAVAFGVWTGRSARADAMIRPALDAAQTLPSFVYLIPFLGLFGPSRFTAIVAAIVYASPIAIKIIAEGIREIPEETMEATWSLGANNWQEITLTQLPMARRSLALATNQGLIYVLSMVVVGGLVGGGGLGYLVVAGFVQLSLFGKGLAAGLTIVVWGVIIDRITQAFAAERRSITTPVRRAAADPAAASGSTTRPQPLEKVA